MGEIALVMGDAGDGLRDRLEAEINAFNVAATGYADGGVLSIAARAAAVSCAAGCSGGPGAAAALSSFCGSAATIAGLAWVPSCWLQPSKRHGAAAVIRWR
jgi:hypothetical protein